MTTVNDQIQEIIKKRSAIMDKIGPEQKKWDGYSELTGNLERAVKALRRSLEDAVRTGKGQKNEDGSEDDLRSLLGKVDSSFSDAVSQLRFKCKRAKEKLQKLEERCNRNTLNISVAGIGRSGKSTALKSLLNLPQSDNSVIPSGGIGALTAGKSILVSVTSKEAEKTEVEFHSQESFMTLVVEPYLNIIYNGESDCSDLDEFLSLNLDELKAQLESEENQDANQIKRIDLIDRLKEIQINIKHVKDKLTGSTITIPLNETGKYVSYQKNEPNICYAVKQVKIYCVFKNNEINSLQLIDLPGLGTCSESERRCFTDGFDYAVDMALIFQRPEGITKNFPTPDDLVVLGILSKTFGKDWKDCAYIFHNNGGISPEVSVEVMNNIRKKVDSWRAEDGKTVPVTCGDSMDPKFMQNELLPSVLNSMMERLPGFDAKLFSTLQNDLKTLEEEFKKKCNELRTSVKNSKSDIKAPDCDEENDELLENFKKVVMKEVKHFLNDQESKDNNRDIIFNAIDNKTEEIRRYFNNRYSPENNEQIEKFILKSYEFENLAAFVTREIQSFRIIISEYYSGLDFNHQEIIKSLQDFIYKTVQKATGNLLPEDGNIDTIITLLDDVDNCDALTQAFKNIRDLEAPFYTILYPDLRIKVFHSNDEGTITQLSLDANMCKTSDPRKTIINCMEFLNEKATEWTNSAKELLQLHTVIEGIIQAAAERFVDNTLRDDAKVKPQIRRFFRTYKPQIVNNEDAWKQDISKKIDNILALLKE